nr:protein new-glue 1-like [Drosophila suzukii]
MKITLVLLAICLGCVMIHQSEAQTATTTTTAATTTTTTSAAATTTTSAAAAAATTTTTAATTTTASTTASTTTTTTTTKSSAKKATVRTFSRTVSKPAVKTMISRNKGCKKSCVQMLTQSQS